jgi:hypothetical protein
MMQLERITLYGLDGQKRSIEFNLNSANIITGRKRTGKSAIIPIVEYCLGSSACDVPRGVIRDSVLWYSITLNLGNEKLFIARRDPDERLSSTDIYVDMGVDIEPPDPERLVQNSTTQALIDLLSLKVGIPEIEAPQLGTGAPKYQITIAHARHYCFLEQEEIDRKTQLFHKQDADHELSIKETLPFFIGAMPDDRFSLLRERNEMRRNLRRLQRDLAQLPETDEENPEATALLAAARAAGLVAAQEGNPMELLARVTEDHDSSYFDLDSLSMAESEFRRHRDVLLDEQRAVRERIEALRALEYDEAGYAGEIDAQRARLSSIDILPPSFNQHSCPLCHQELEQRLPAPNALRDSLVALRDQLEFSRASQPRLERAISSLEARKAELGDELRQNQAKIASIVRQRSDLSRSQAAALESAITRGRITQFVEMQRLAYSDRDKLSDRIASLRERLEVLEELLSWDDIEERMTTMVGYISEDITAYARELNLEYHDRVRLDPKNLTIIADTKRNAIRLRHIGSGSNWVGYHLATYTALQKWFTENDRPVPNFVIFDQPSQPYYSASSGRVEYKSSDDEIEVQRMFEFLLDVPRKCSGKVQVIVMDHVRLEQDLVGFEAAKVADWHESGALIPESWPRKKGSAQPEDSPGDDDDF